MHKGELLDDAGDGIRRADHSIHAHLPEERRVLRILDDADRFGHAEALLAQLADDQIVRVAVRQRDGDVRPARPGFLQNVGLGAVAVDDLKPLDIRQLLAAVVVRVNRRHLVFPFEQRCGKRPRNIKAADEQHLHAHASFASFDLPSRRSISRVESTVGQMVSMPNSL